MFDFVAVKSFFHVFALQRVGFEKIFDVGFFVDGKNAKGYLSYQLLTHGSKDNKNVRFIFYISWYSSLSDNKNNDLVLVREKRISKLTRKYWSK